MMEAIKKNAIFALLLLAVLGLGVFWIWRRTGEESGGGGAGIIEQPSQFAPVRAEILGTIATLQAIQLDITVLSEPVFQSLTEAPQLPTGPLEFKKRNPFLP